MTQVDKALKDNNLEWPRKNPRFLTPVVLDSGTQSLPEDVSAAIAEHFGQSNQPTAEPSEASTSQWSMAPNQTSPPTAEIATPPEANATPGQASLSTSAIAAPDQTSQPTLGTIRTYFIFVLHIFGLWRPGNSSIRSASRFCAIPGYRWAEIFHDGPVFEKKKQTIQKKYSYF